ncbi:copper amine oxidase N-terminal domain-containing protein [Ammoniphilus resinae]|uniref:Copper amine oxidase-like N-terminal domain-containing protein n=1 Tax=Ammoniphilus resinae TaxID=861532 RepID=A0ABS4GVA7_9BACL|nr:copper amine oxidase N-terminal domain-containing protein [Ammoniphilus resinae]MBP1934204.1 hypothetical protein [Ammoniphilus resinae]
MKKFLFGFVTGALVFGSIGAIAASSEMKLIVNGYEVKSDVPPQVINGRTVIPARPLAEALGAKVEWDEQNRAVVITTSSGNQQTIIDDNPNHDVYHDLNDDGPTHHQGDDDPNHDLNDDNGVGEDHHGGKDGNDDHGEHQNRDRDGEDR